MKIIQRGSLKIALILATLTFGTFNHPALAIEAYSSAEQEQFMDWCTGAKSATESTCSCTLKTIAPTIPATALSQFLSNQGGFSLSAIAVSTGAAITQALLSCSKG